VIQNLSEFVLPKNFRGRSIVTVQIWWFVHALLFRGSPQFAYRFRAGILRIFGAKIGSGVLIRPTVRITYPWKVSIGDNAWIGDDVVLYSLGEIEIGENAVVSQNSYLCAADHDYRQPNFPIRAAKVHVQEEAWVASDVFISPGVTIGRGAVIGARSLVTKNMPARMVCHGSPCKPVKRRQCVVSKDFASMGFSD
jgi:putative colanic acid biosynthesis acetyltransferase WcaF